MPLQSGVPVPMPWVEVTPPPPVSYPTRGNHYEVFATPTARAVLVLVDSSWIAAVYDPVIGRWHRIVEKGTQDSHHFRSRREALYRANIVARDMDSARVSRLPDFRHEDLGKYLTWFEAQVPNRIDYVRLLLANDPNGAYDALLAEPVHEAEEIFEDVFEDHLPKPNPGASRERLRVAEGRLGEVERALRHNPGSPELASAVAECKADCANLRARLA